MTPITLIGDERHSVGHVNHVGCAPCSVAGTEPERGDAVYVEAEKVFVERANAGHHGCARHGGEQQRENGK